MNGFQLQKIAEQGCDVTHILVLLNPRQRLFGNAGEGLDQPAVMSRIVNTGQGAELTSL